MVIISHLLLTWPLGKYMAQLYALALKQSHWEAGLKMIKWDACCVAGETSKLQYRPLTSKILKMRALQWVGSSLSSLLQRQSDLLPKQYGTWCSEACPQWLDECEKQIRSFKSWQSIWTCLVEPTKSWEGWLGINCLFKRQTSFSIKALECKETHWAKIMQLFPPPNLRMLCDWAKT